MNLDVDMDMDVDVDMDVDMAWPVDAGGIGSPNTLFRCG